MGKTDSPLGTYDVFRESLEDILDNDDFRKLGEISHHGNSILNHSLKVSWLAWKWSEKLGWDSRSVCRGALLHDFFLYDWKVKRPGTRKYWEIWKMHGFTHGNRALENAEQRFSLNPVERDIIKRHMFPLTPVPPRYRESWLVSFCDKAVSLGEIPLYGKHLLSRKN